MIIMDIDVILIYHEIYYWYITLDIIKGIVRYNEQRKVTIYSNSDGRDQPSITTLSSFYFLGLRAGGDHLYRPVYTKLFCWASLSASPGPRDPYLYCR